MFVFTLQSACFYLAKCLFLPCKVFDFTLQSVWFYLAKCLFLPCKVFVFTLQSVCFEGVYFTTTLYEYIYSNTYIQCLVCPFSETTSSIFTKLVNLMFNNRLLSANCMMLEISSRIILF